MNGAATYFRECTYYLRFCENKKLKLVNVGGELDAALMELRKRSSVLEANSLGMVVEDPEVRRMVDSTFAGLLPPTKPELVA